MTGREGDIGMQEVLTAVIAIAGVAILLYGISQVDFANFCKSLTQNLRGLLRILPVQQFCP
ncbi:MAG: hypothetical protein SVW77_02665 [Candidatus Nanohaloarchaea archaeon]|nr:hypothetical protein [Candidatus Nanohaloarchaea archaeon]